MRKISTITSIAAPLPEANIDTDAIFPARFLLLLDKTGIGKYLFNERKADKDFVLNTPPYDKTEILITGPRFGIGSSREHAAWALSDFGIKCVIAPSFGDIFFANCIKNGILPIVLEPEDHERIMSAAQMQTSMTIDLPAKTVRIGQEQPIAFNIKESHKRALLLGLDEIGEILANDAADITAFEQRQKTAQPWLYLSKAQLAIFDEMKTKL